MQNEMILISSDNLQSLLTNTIKAVLNDFTASFRQSPTQQQDELLTQQQAVKLLQISEATLIEWKKQKRIPYTKIGKRVFYSRQAIMNLI